MFVPRCWNYQQFCGILPPVMKQILFVFSIALSGLFITNAHAQTTTTWPSPEVEQMYKDARQYYSQGNLRQAIITYQQAVQIAPEIMILHRDLGQAYYMAGDYENALNTLEPIVKTGAGDDQCYQVIAASYIGSGENKKARNTLQKGIERHPKSGLLYHEMGKMYEDENEPVYALESWLNGIAADPAYHVNYYEAARMYMYTNKPVWAILYGEMFVNIEQQTPRANETRTMIMDAYRKLFSSLATGELPKFGNKKTNQPENFEEAVYTTFIKLSPVVSDGVTAENLTMLRTRFLMDWSIQYAAKYPFTLFTRQDEMLRSSLFDIYNEWLFGRSENQQFFEAWKKFHPEAIPSLETWLQQHPYRPAATDAYNKKEIDDIFPKRIK